MALISVLSCPTWTSGLMHPPLAVLFLLASSPHRSGICRPTPQAMPRHGLLHTFQGRDSCALLHVRNEQEAFVGTPLSPSPIQPSLQPQGTPCSSPNRRDFRKPSGFAWRCPLFQICLNLPARISLQVTLDDLSAYPTTAKTQALSVDFQSPPYALELVIAFQRV